MKLFNRRNFFIKGLSAAVPAVWWSCNSSSSKPSVATQSGSKVLKKDPQAMELSRVMNRKQVHAMVEQRVDMVMERSHHCAQSSFYTISTQFGLGGDDVLKALTPLPGIAERGETCGAVTGCLMAMGLVFGRDRLDDWEGYRKSLNPCNSFCQKFQTKMGTINCCQIQEKKFGTSYNLMDPEDLRAFQRANATQKCGEVVKEACRIATDIILDET